MSGRRPTLSSFGASSWLPSTFLRCRFPLKKWNQLVAALKLSPQHIRIVELILRNCGDRQIATELGLKVPTVRTHLHRIFERLEVEDRGALVLILFAASHQTAPPNTCHQM